MDGGRPVDALIDMTAGVNEEFEMYEPEKKQVKPASFKKKMNRLLHQAYTRKSMLGCGINADPSETETHLPNGLMKSID
jgi:hypothetical protein